jgi:ATPase subunit of ABC transporter with duplicated ATPase domains
MPRIVFDGVRFTHDDRRPFPDPLHLDLAGHWTGIVGPNGAGKSTLLRLILGELACERGSIRIEPRSAVIREVAQTGESLDPTIERLADDPSGEARRLRAELELQPHELERWPTLSPGERKRWQIAAALLDEPDILLCDEPSNHLDMHARSLLVRALHRHRGLGLLISHDRALLDELCTATLFVERGGVELRPGCWSAATREREREHEHARERHELAREQLDRIDREVQRARQRHASAERSRSSASRKRDHRDHDASSSARKFRADRAATSQAAALHRTQVVQARQRAIVEAWQPPPEHGGSLFVDWQPPRKRVLVHTRREELDLRVGIDLPDAADTLQIARDDKIWLRGRNGAGKTTLLLGLLARARESLQPDRVLWLPQELDHDRRRALLSELASLPKPERGRVLEIVARAGIDPDDLLATPDPSPGEARKLALALALARQAWLLLLDEPTHHLDLPAIEAIERMLVDYPGALVLVSHDPSFAERCTKTRWQLGA